jgi:2-polyprenyl-6-methoxyphenol hydroxylase-like FAD-dependent oxidoreductase
MWSVLLGSGSAFLTIPIGNGHVYCYCDGPLDDPPASPRDLLSDYAEPVPTLLDTIGGASAVHAAQVEEVVLGSWSRRGVLLIGDAAHATSPNMAQGAAMALEDAIVLAESLTAADSVAEALSVYEHRRRPRTDWVLAQTHRRDRARTLPPAIRSMVLKRLGRRIFRSNYLPLRTQP